jgi:hypothetical protein
MLSPRLILALVPVVLFAGCQTLQEKKKKEAEKKKTAQDDPAFQSFLGRLRIAVQKKDYAMIQQMMAPDFHYRWDEPQPGDSVFTYWSMHSTWSTLSYALQRSFIPYAAEGGDTYMVATEDRPEGRYAAGIKMVGGSWRFAYFLPPEPPEQSAQ